MKAIELTTQARQVLDFCEAMKDDDDYGSMMETMMKSAKDMDEGMYKKMKNMSEAKMKKMMQEMMHDGMMDKMGRMKSSMKKEIMSKFGMYDKGGERD